MNWNEATLHALTKMSLRHGRNTFTRQEILDEELDWIAETTSSVGKTPAQSLSKVLQILRDQGFLEFHGDGEYTLLSSTQVPVAVDIPDEYEVPNRVESTIHRVSRDSGLVSELKRLYFYRCSLCDIRIELPSGYYCEAHHLKPLGSPHNGPDVAENLVVVCPNHHVMLDYGALLLSDGSLRSLKHSISQEFLDYHNNVVCGGA